MARWWGQVLRHAPAIWVEKGNGITGRVGAQTLSMSQLPRWKWKSEKPIAIGTHNSELTPRCGRILRGGFGTPASLPGRHRLEATQGFRYRSGTGLFLVLSLSTTRRNGRRQKAAIAVPSATAAVLKHFQAATAQFHVPRQDLTFIVCIVRSFKTSRAYSRRGHVTH